MTLDTGVPDLFDEHWHAYGGGNAIVTYNNGFNNTRSGTRRRNIGLLHGKIFAGDVFAELVPCKCLCIFSCHVRDGQSVEW
jgi:hypothetical protein